MSHAYLMARLLTFHYAEGGLPRGGLAGKHITAVAGHDIFAMMRPMMLNVTPRLRDARR